MYVCVCVCKQNRHTDNIDFSVKYYEMDVVWMNDENVTNKSTVK